jgi:hypothetical protein
MRIRLPAGSYRLARPTELIDGPRIQLSRGTDEESYPAFQRTAAEIETRVRFLLHVIRQRPPRR